MTKIFIFFIVLIACLISCKLKKVNIFEGGGVFIQTIDSSQRANIKIVHFNNSIGVVFPASFGIKIFGTDRSKSLSYFDPDTALIKRIDKEINYQYCLASERYNGKYWGKMTHRSRTDSLKPLLSITEKELTNKISLRECLYWQENNVFFDKQYIGYISPAGEKIIRIKLIDFRQDPHHLKQYVKTSWIDGWHGWFYSNLHEVYFHINKNLLTFDEGI